MSKVIVGLSGYAQSGKDTIADILVSDYEFERIAFAGILRECMEALNPIVNTVVLQEQGMRDELWHRRYSDVVAEFGYNEAKGMFPEIRELLQRMGTEVGRNVLGENVWVDAAMRKVGDGNYVFTDMRFPNEFDAIIDADGYTWRVKRPGTGPVNGHPSETALDNHNFDWVIDNDGTILDLRRKVQEIMEGIP